MSKKYTSSFPLVLGSTIRLKIARLAVALAARLFSTDESYENVIVTQHHVEYVYQFLNRIYNKPSFGYGEYSEIYDEDTGNSRDDIIDDLKTYCENFKSFCINMLKNPKITVMEIRDFMGCGHENADKLRQQMVSSGLLIKKGAFYIKSEKFRVMLKKEVKKG